VTFTGAAITGVSDLTTTGDTIIGDDLSLTSDGAVINIGAGNDVTITHSANTLTVGGGNLALGANSLTLTGSIGATGARSTKGWFTDLEVTNAIAGSVTGNAATVTIADAADDTTTFPLLGTAATGSLAPATDASLTYNASSGLLSSTALTLGGTLTLQNSETITNADDTEIAFNGTEAIALDLDTGTANQVIIKNRTTSSTAVDDLYSQIPFRAPAKFLSYTAAQTLTAAAHNGAIVMMTTADEVTMWDCTSSTIGHFVTLWARDAEKIEVVPASGDQFYLFNGTGIGANDELDIAATAGTKVTLMCTAADEWRVVTETAACTDGGAAD
jgi:hypothetical protein